MPYGIAYSETEYARTQETGTIPEGLYRVRVKDVSAERTKESKAPMANVQLLIAEGEYEGQPLWRRFPLPIEDEEGRAAGGLSAGDKMGYARFLNPFLEAIGAPKRGLRPDAWIGEELWVRVKLEEYEGAAQAKLAGFFSKRPAR